MRTSRSFAALLALVLAACGGGGSDDGPTNPGTGSTGGSTGGSTTGGSTSNAISVGDNAFSPSGTTVTTGTTVTWSWAGSNQHNVTFDDGTKSTTQASGSYTRTFATAGSYPYHCTIHGAAMSGTVTVK